MNEKEREDSQIKNIGLGIISSSAILFALISFTFRFFYPYYFSTLLILIILMQALLSIGLFVLFLRSSQVIIGNYLICMGLGLIIFGILIMIIANLSVIVLFQYYMYYFILFGFPLGYFSGPICVLLGILNKKVKDHIKMEILSLSGLLIFAISFISITLTFSYQTCC